MLMSVIANEMKQSLPAENETASQKASARDDIIQVLLSITQFVKLTAGFLPSIEEQCDPRLASMLSIGRTDTSKILEGNHFPAPHPK